VICITKRFLGSAGARAGTFTPVGDGRAEYSEPMQAAVPTTAPSRHNSTDSVGDSARGSGLTGEPGNWRHEGMALATAAAAEEW